MALKATAVLANVHQGGPDSLVMISYMLNDSETGDVAGHNYDLALPVLVTDDAASIHTKAAQAIRDERDDQSIVVMFLDGSTAQ